MKLKDNFPNTNLEALKYNGFLYSINKFCTVFEFENDLHKTIETINIYLLSNGYNILEFNQIDEELNFSNEVINLSKHGYKEELVLFINRENPISDLDGVIELLKEFTSRRDWEQFHNSKDLSLAISIEASELNELFLWKDNEDFNIEKLKEELADVLSFSLLLAEKNNLNVIDIIKEKIAKNELKYPVSKSKGTAKKYNEL